MINLNPPYSLIHLPSIDSTNVYAGKILMEHDVSEGTVILADYQSEGKGQGGTVWASDAGKNLLFSLILKPFYLTAERQFYLSMCISNALAALVKSKTGNSLIKWPNDILVNESKIAGILIENTIMGDYLNTSVVGIGLNVNQTEFPPDIPSPVSLSLITGVRYEIPEILNEILAMISSELQTLQSGRLDTIKTAYLNRLSRLNHWNLYTDSTGLFEGRITDVAESGELMVMNRKGEIRKYGFKEIVFSGSPG